MTTVLPIEYGRAYDRTGWTETVAEYKARLALLPSLTTAGGVKVEPCPATYLDTNCKDCGLCQRQHRKVAVGFPAHWFVEGQGERRWSRMMGRETMEQAHDTENCAGGPDCPYRCPPKQYKSLKQNVIDRQTLARPVTQWREIFREQTDGSMTAIAERILGDLWDYKNHGRYQEQDVVSLANALLAVLNRAGVN